MSEAKKLIDVEKIIREKKPGLLKFGFLVRYLKRILHEDDINEFIDDNKDADPIEFCLAVMKRFNISVKHVGLENIPKEGGTVLAMNHPWGGMDAMALVTVVHERRPDIKFIVNDLLMNLENLAPIFVGVNKLGPNAKASLNQVDKAFAGDDLLCIFPSGLVSRKIKGEIIDMPWKRSFITRSRRHDKVIIPTYIDGKLSNFFYNLSNIRKKLGIKVNIEMLYLANEMFKQDNSSITIKFGEPIYTRDFKPEEKDHDLSEMVRDKVYQLRK